MEQNAHTGVPVAPMAENKQKSGNGLKIATTIACLVAACGIGFGVYSIMQGSQKDNQIAELNSEITQLKQSIEELENTIEDTKINDKTNMIIDDWKLKIKIPESISVVSYALDKDNDDWLSIAASPVNDRLKTATVGLVKVDKTAVESGNAQWTSLEEAAFLDDDFAYYLMYTDTTSGRDLTIDELIIDALSDSTLYSKI